MGYLIGAAILGIAGLIMWIMKGKKEGKSATLQSIETSDVKDVNELWESMRNSMGDGSFTHIVELKGVAHADSPLTSELAKTECVYYSSKITHKYEKLERKKNSEGKMEEKWVKHEDIVSENKQWANNFGVKDSTGFIQVDPTKAELHEEQLYSTFEKGDPSENNALNVKIGGVSFGIGKKDKGYKTIGYKYEEHGIKLGSDLYVVGDANDRDGKVEVSKPKDKKQPFIVSIKSKDQIVGSLGSAITGLKWGSFISWGLAGAALIAGILNLLKVF
ncbi:MAG: E3 ubiquitin ligase family protein [Flavobacteriales bacterium]|nr:E3 ubiquitin ligase family protein [Flavobacteriales bacterium]